MGGAQLIQDYRATIYSLFFTTQFPGVPGTNLIDLGRIKD